MKDRSGGIDEMEPIAGKQVFPVFVGPSCLSFLVFPDIVLEFLVVRRMGDDTLWW